MNRRMEIFVEEYLKSFNATDAARKAGYSEASIDAAASRLLKNVSINKRIQEQKIKLQSKSIVSVERIIQELACVAFSDMTDILMWTDAGISFHDSKQLPEHVRRSISEVQEKIDSEGGTKKIKLYDKLKALELLGKYFDMWGSENKEADKNTSTNKSLVDRLKDV